MLKTQYVQKWVLGSNPPATIKVTIDKNGTAKVDAVSGQGSSCVEKTKWVEQALGKTISQECATCHSVLAQEEKDPEILKTLLD